MITLIEFSEKYRISHKKAKRMMRDGVLRVADAPSAACAGIIDTLANRAPLSALQLCDLLESPSLVLSLGKYADKASAQAQAIGDASGERAPVAVAAALSDAARGDPEALETVAGWLRSILPAEPVGHSWIACRLLLAFPANVRGFEVPRVIKALGHVRRLESFSGWFTVSKQPGRIVTIYKRPENPLASFDL